MGQPKPQPDLAALEAQLRSEGFRHTYVWQDGPLANYPDHTHPIETAHIILEGEMTLTTVSGGTTYGAGSRFRSDGPRRLPVPHRREVGK